MARPSARFRRRFTLVVFAAAAVFLAPAHAAVRLDPLMDDFGQFKVSAHGRSLGTEIFSYETDGDSVAVFSNVTEDLPTPDGTQKLDKKVQVSIKLLDGDLLGYASEQNFLGKQLLRGIVPGDTAFTAYRESMGRGYGDRYVRPPGRLFIIDSQVFTLFDLMLRTLHGKLTSDRSLSVIVLGDPRDSVMEISVSPGANELVRWGGGSVPAQRVILSDGNSEFVASVASSGRMLQLDEPRSGLHVERDPVAPKMPGAIQKPSTRPKVEFRPAGAPPPAPAPKKAAAKKPAPTH